MVQLKTAHSEVNYRRDNRIEIYVVVALLTITALIVLFQNSLLTRQLSIELDDSVNIVARDDRPFGGNSVASVKRTSRGIELDCEISDGYDWPYCEVWIDLKTSKNQGLNLAKFSRVGIWSYHDPAVETGTRFQIHNFNPLYSKPNDSETLKYNAIEYYEKRNSYPIWIDFERFHVPTWWLTRHDLPLDEVGVDVSNSQSMAFVTGSHIAPGNYKLVIEKIMLEGRILSPADVFLWVLVLWVSAALIFLYRSFQVARYNLIYAKKREKEWEQKATSDPLTGAMNRIGMQNVFETARQEQPDTALSVIYLDVDHFKKINDNHGHRIGDAVLCDLVKCIEQGLTDNDKLARWGGEEFIIACLDRDLNEAVALAEQIRQRIEHNQWPKQLPITASFGVAQQAQESIEHFIHRADSALYRAKQNGRNRVESDKQES